MPVVVAAAVVTAAVAAAAAVVAAAVVVAAAIVATAGELKSEGLRDACERVAPGPLIVAQAPKSFYGT